MRHLDGGVCGHACTTVVLLKRKDPCFFKQLLKHEVSKPKLDAVSLPAKKKVN